ncbi:MAG: hypothetical protein CMJ74_13260 [Planctomycetaceae bacterium]|nr:hypothetical protein [Planctomycetaceae bacterium]|tara:strand:- start:3711 stop:5207 length:1497 start_codon:yes stop_codon:yes gene_type:complete
MDLQTVLLILGILGTILFLVALVMSYKSWRWHTVLLVWLVFAASCVAIWMSVQTLKIHQSWRELLLVDDRERTGGKPIAGLIEKTESLRKQNHELEFGAEDGRGRITSYGIAQLELKLAVALLDRGRMWNDAAPLDFSDDVVTVQFDRPQTYRLESDLPVYAFSSEPFMKGGKYLGMFRVVEVTGNQATEDEQSAGGGEPLQAMLQPQWPLSQAERDMLRKSVEEGGFWILYDKMPVDQHLVFDRMEAADLDVEEDAFDAMDRVTRLRKILPERTVQEFIDDYQSAQPGHPPERIEELVEFLEDYPDEDAKARFVEGQNVWLPREGAEAGRTIAIRDSITGGTLEVEAIPAIGTLIDNEVVERIEEDGSPRYSRQLRDYAHLFRELYHERKRQDFEIAETVSKITEVQTLITDKQKVIDLFEKEKGRLARDQQQFVQDRKIIDQLVSQIRRKYTASNRRLVEIRDETIQLGKKLTEKQLNAVKEIDRRAPDPNATSGS